MGLGFIIYANVVSCFGFFLLFRCERMLAFMLPLLHNPVTTSTSDCAFLFLDCATFFRRLRIPLCWRSAIRDKRHLPVSFKHLLPGCQAFPASLQNFLCPRDSAWIASFPATRVTFRGITGTACAISAMPVSSPRAGAVRSWGSQSRILACRISLSIDMVLKYFLDVLRRILSSGASICQDVIRSLGLC